MKRHSNDVKISHLIFFFTAKESKYFRSGLVYICLSCILWIVYLQIFNHASLTHWVSCFSESFIFYWCQYKAANSALVIAQPCGTIVTILYMFASYEKTTGCIE